MKSWRSVLRNAKQLDHLIFGNLLSKELAHAHGKAIPNGTFSYLRPLPSESQSKIKQLRAPDSNHFSSTKRTDNTVEILPSTYSGL